MGEDQNTKRIAESKEGFLTRRGLLQRAAWIVPATAFIPRWVRAAQDVSPAMAKLSTYMAAARETELPEKVVQDAKFHILDTVAAMVSGSELPPGRDAIQFARTYGGGQKIATVVASKTLCGPMDAAFANGELAHADKGEGVQNPEGRRSNRNSQSGGHDGSGGGQCLRRKSQCPADALAARLCDTTGWRRYRHVAGRY